MKNTIVFPSRYIQGNGVIEELPEHIERFGGKGFIIATKSVFDVMRDVAEKCNAAVERFSADCTRPEINRLKALAANAGATVVIGAGGGRPMDTARVVADELGVPCITCPTVASSDAACAFLSVVNGTKDAPGVAEFHFCKTNPVLVLADEALILRAPPYTLALGMADALSTWFEAESCSISGALSFSGGARTDMAMAVARLCYDNIMLYGRDAMKGHKSAQITPAFSKIVEANILISGCGFGGCGLASAHGIGTIFEMLPNDIGTELHHGEVVAFGVLCGVWINQKPLAEIEALYSLFYDIGLPITFEQLGFFNVGGEKLDAIVNIALRRDLGQFPYQSFVYNEPVPVNYDTVKAAILNSDRYGREYIARMKSIR